jgi:hypothetical protein
MRAMRRSQGCRGGRDEQAAARAEV